MNSKRVTLQSGKELHLNLADFKNSMGLNRAIMSALSKSDLDMDIGDLQGKDEKDIGGVLTSLMPLLFTVSSSEDVENAVIACLSRCKWGGLQVTQELLEDNQDARADFYEMAFECVKFNSAVFMKPILSKLKQSGQGTANESQK